MKYISTRGKAPALNFEQVLLTGLASDGGLYVPETYPQFSAQEIASWSGLPYSEVAIKVISPFVAGCIPQAELENIIRETYTTFRHPAVTPLVQLNSNEWVLELFHGPTLAFKDVALQLLGRLLDAVLAKRQERVVIMGATWVILARPPLKAAAAAKISTFLFCIRINACQMCSVNR